MGIFWIVVFDIKKKSSFFRVIHVMRSTKRKTSRRKRNEKMLYLMLFIINLLTEKYTSLWTHKIDFLPWLWHKIFNFIIQHQLIRHKTVNKHWIKASRQVLAYVLDSLSGEWSIDVSSHLLLFQSMFLIILCKSFRLIGWNGRIVDFFEVMLCLIK